LWWRSPGVAPGGLGRLAPRMADILAPKQRSALMAHIRSTGNASTELKLVALLRAAGIRGWRRGVRLPLPRQNEEGRVQKADDGGRTTEGGGRRAEDRKGSPQRTRRARSGNRKSRGSSSVISVNSAGRIGRQPSVVGRLLTVRPDFVFRRERLVVFVDGCFWHGCPIHFTRPKSRRVFWDAKIAANRARDRRLDRALRAAGWRVLHVWEHALAPREIARTLARVRRAVGSACGLRRRVSRAARCGTRLGRTLARVRRAADISNPSCAHAPHCEAVRHQCG